MIPQYILDTVFNKFDDNTYWARTADGEGYVVWWTHGETYHTYHYPPEWLNG